MREPNNPNDIELDEALRAVGFKPQDIPGLPEGVVAFVPQEPAPSDPWEGFEVISTYTRKQAIEDGVLVDLMQPPLVGLVLQAGFRLHVAMTAAAFEAAIGTGELPVGQDCNGRLWDLLMVLRVAIRKLPPEEDRVFFDLAVWDGKRHNTVKLWCHCGPGDDAKPVLTIMLPEED